MNRSAHLEHPRSKHRAAFNRPQRRFRFSKDDLGPGGETSFLGRRPPAFELVRDAQNRRKLEFSGPTTNNLLAICSDGVPLNLIQALWTWAIEPSGNSSTVGVRLGGTWLAVCSAKGRQHRRAIFRRRNDIGLPTVQPAGCGASGGSCQPIRGTSAVRGRFEFRSASVI
jgi:hypothetical protein